MLHPAQYATGLGFSAKFISDRLTLGPLSSMPTRVKILLTEAFHWAGESLPYQPRPKSLYESKAGHGVDMTNKVHWVRLSALPRASTWSC